MKQTNYNGIILSLGLTIAFVVLRAAGVIEWSLWWVFSPVLIYYGIIVGVPVAVFLFVFFGSLFVYLFSFILAAVITISEVVADWISNARK